MYCVIVFYVKHNLVKLFNCTVRWVYSSFCVKHNLIKLLYLLYCKAFSTALCEGYSYHNVYCVLDWTFCNCVLRKNTILWSFSTALCSFLNRFTSNTIYCSSIHSFIFCFLPVQLSTIRLNASHSLLGPKTVAVAVAVNVHIVKFSL